MGALIDFVDAVRVSTGLAISRLPITEDLTGVAEAKGIGATSRLRCGPDGVAFGFSGESTEPLPGRRSRRKAGVPFRESIPANIFRMWEYPFLSFSTSRLFS